MDVMRKIGRQSATPEVVWDTEADRIDRVFVWEGHSVSGFDGDEMKRAKTSGVVNLNWLSLQNFYHKNQNSFCLYLDKKMK